MYRLHIANKHYSSWSLRPWVLMRTLNIPFEEVLTPFDGAMNWHRFRAFSPTGTVPCLEAGDIVVWESLAIVEFLAERHAGVWPADPAARAWARAAAAEMHAGFSTLRNRCPMAVGVRVRLRDHPSALARDLARLAELWAEGLGRFGGPFLAGNRFSAVDAFFAPVAFRLQSYGLVPGGAADVYARHLLAQPAMADWYAAGLAEPWRDAAHEADIAATGTVLTDLRTPLKG
ncbi:glutathione S-transferase [Tistrella mobilis]|uniref:glutathione S-transferase n=1 Tax=Tistrella mobilis TaxID=171437 RepID=UPI0035569796